MKKLLSILLTLALLGSAALAETDAQTRTRDIMVEGVAETVTETLFTSASGYSIWLQEGWGWSASTDDAADHTVTDETATGDTATDDTTTGEATTDETATDDGTWLDAGADAADDGTWLGDESLNYAPDVYVPADNADISLTVQPALGLTADDADGMLSEATYTEDTEATISGIGAFAMEGGLEAKTVEVISEGTVYRYWFIPGDSFCLCVTAQFPEEATEGYGARMDEMVASIAFTA